MASMKKAGMKAADKVKKRLKEPKMVEINEPNTPGPMIECGWGGVSNSQTTGNNLVKGK